MRCPVPLRGEEAQEGGHVVQARDHLLDATSATWMRGAPVEKRMFPSFSTITRVPVSATAKLAPRRPSRLQEPLAQHAARDPGQHRHVLGGRVPSSRWKSAETSPRDLWIAGRMMCDGVSCASCTMYSPRSVSTGVTPAGLERGVEVDLLGRHRLGLHRRRHAASARQVDDVAARLRRVAGPGDRAALLLHARLELRQVMVETGERLPLDLPRADAQRLPVRPLRERLHPPRHRARGRRPQHAHLGGVPQRLRRVRAEPV
jgi:hypothetical protein